MNNLKEIRKKHGLSQVDFASQLGVAQNTVSNWENGNRLIDAEMLIKISKMFKVSIDYVLGINTEDCDMPQCLSASLVLTNPEAASGDLLRSFQEMKALSIYKEQQDKVPFFKRGINIEFNKPRIIISVEYEDEFFLGALYNFLKMLLNFQYHSFMNNHCFIMGVISTGNIRTKYYDEYTSSHDISTIISNAKDLLPRVIVEDCIIKQILASDYKFYFDELIKTDSDNIAFLDYLQPLLVFKILDIHSQEILFEDTLNQMLFSNENTPTSNEITIKFVEWLKKYKQEMFTEYKNKLTAHRSFKKPSAPLQSDNTNIRLVAEENNSGSPVIKKSPRLSE